MQVFFLGGEEVLCYFCQKQSKSFLNTPKNPDVSIRAEIIYLPLQVAGLTSRSNYLLYTYLILFN